MNRDEIVDAVASQLGIDADDEDAMEEAGIILFDGMEPAFLGLAERFEPVLVRTRVVTTVVDEAGRILDTSTEESETEVGGTHRSFVVYSYARMVETLMADGDMDDMDAREYLEFNTVGAYVGPTTPAILRDLE